MHPPGFLAMAPEIGPETTQRPPHLESASKHFLPSCIRCPVLKINAIKPHDQDGPVSPQLAVKINRAEGPVAKRHQGFFDEAFTGFQDPGWNRKVPEGDSKKLGLSPSSGHVPRQDLNAQNGANALCLQRLIVNLVAGLPPRENTR